MLALKLWSWVLHISLVRHWLRHISRKKTLTKPGGLLPMIPYFIWIHDVQEALQYSIGITGAVLLAFGAVKAKITGARNRDVVIGAAETLLVGGLAAASAYGIVRAVNSADSL